ncbi:hypothetical protein D6853_07000 [Butyrivibrio sp. X503]|uniref:hypothetical protein n=1 Tax=Butyrivibrio sp. X503 TaxID=2364878 RepID=UPI000EA8AC2C|nr:hypothetical protein [Butyrivibrio sp. X503]RKM56528.1 hypothetical protein D6853_07000 [Butyrivibrio sp. X503]
MKKAITKIITVLVVVSVAISALVGCSYNDPWRRIAVTQLGPNDENLQYVYRVVKGEKYPGTVIVGTDVESGEDTKLFEVENTESDRIHEVVECRGGVLFTLSRPYANTKYSLNYLSFNRDFQNIDMQTLYASEFNLILREKDGEISLIENYDQKFVISYGTHDMSWDEMQESDKIEEHSLYDDIPERSYIMNDGMEVVLKKNFGEENYTGVVGDNTYAIDSISGKDYIYAQWGCFSEVDGKLYGIITIPKNRLSKNRMKGGSTALHSDYVKKEVLFSLDVTTGENNVVYQTKKGRIIGFTSDTVYLIDKNDIYKVDIASGQQEKLTTIQAKKNTDLDFRWIGSRLFIFESLTQETVAVIEG